MSKRINSMMASRVGLAVFVTVTVAIVAGGVSYASIPDSSGVIHGCYKARGAASPLSVINTSIHPKCPNGYTALKWDASPPGIGVGTGVATPGSNGGETCTLGEVSLIAQQGRYLPTNYMIAKGQTLMIGSYTALFTLLGTSYGGNGTSTLKLPTLQSLAPDHMTYAICAYGVFP
jgi:hypothetical protein